MSLIALTFAVYPISVAAITLTANQPIVFRFDHGPIGTTTTLVSDLQVSFGTPVAENHGVTLELGHSPLDASFGTLNWQNTFGFPVNNVTHGRYRGNVGAPYQQPNTPQSYLTIRHNGHDVDVSGTRFRVVYQNGLNGQGPEQTIAYAGNLISPVGPGVPEDEVTPEERSRVAIFVDFNDPFVLRERTTYSLAYSNYVTELVLEEDATKEVQIDKARVVEELERILSDSALNIDVVTDEQTLDSYQSVIRARFDPNAEVSLLGDARDIRLEAQLSDGIGYLVSELDRFDLRKNGTVDIYFDEATYGDGSELDEGQRIYIARLAAATIAHEAGHGFGLTHIEGKNAQDNPIDFTSEVMDYDFDASVPEVFSGQVSDVNHISGGLNDAGYIGTSFPSTHNPQYHLRRYALGEDVSDLEPGSYDIANIDNFFSNIALTFSDAADQSALWFLQFAEEDSGFGTSNEVVSLADFFDDGELRLLVDPFASFRILGQDSGSDELNLSIGIFDQLAGFSNSLSLASLLSREAHVAEYDMSLGFFSQRGAIDVRNLGTYDFASGSYQSSEVSEVPLPASFGMTLVGLFALFGRRIALTFSRRLTVGEEMRKASIT